MAAAWQPSDSLATIRQGLNGKRRCDPVGEKSLYMGVPMAHMHASEKKPMHSGARGGGILIA